MELVVFLLVGVFVAILIFGALEISKVNRRIDQNLEELRCLTNGHRMHKIKNGLRYCRCGARL